MKDTIFVRMVEANVDAFQTKDVKLDNNMVDIIWIHKQDGEPCNNMRILALVKKFKDISKEKLEGPLPVRELSNEIISKGSLLKSGQFYLLALKKDEIILDHFKKAISTGIILSSKAQCRTVVFFVHNKT